VTPGQPENHLRGVERVAQQLEEEGWIVTREPKQAPFDLGGYIPDILAVRGTEGLIVEVKSSESRIDVEKYASVSRAVSARAGWRFLLVPADTAGSGDRSLSAALPSWSQLGYRQRELAGVASRGNPARLLAAWSVLEGAMRRLGEENAVPVAQLSPRSMIAHLYSLGLLSLEQHRLLNQALPIRNAVAHGYSVEAADDAADVALAIANSLIGSREY
jgi:hypothetical protein